MLACSERPLWNMVATDIDAESVSSARKIVEKNADKLGDRIQIRQVDPEGPLFPLEELGIQRYFTLQQNITETG